MLTDQQSCLYVVATPIGHLGDMSFRAVDTLKAADLIAAEDTRVTRKLLSHYDITGKELVSYETNKEAQTASLLISRMVRDRIQVALVTDAGTPCVSDPGYAIINEAHQANIKVVPIPGVSALTTLVSIAGLPNHELHFIGFIEPGSIDWQQMESWRGSLVAYVSPHKILRVLRELVGSQPGATLALGRELTKFHEELLRGDPASILATLESRGTQKGEFTLMIQLPKTRRADPLDLDSKLIARIKAGDSTKDMLKTFKGCGLSRSELYQRILKLQDQ